MSICSFKFYSPHLYQIYKFVNPAKRTVDFNKPSVSYRLMCISKGKIVIEINGTQYGVAAGDVFFMPPEETYSTYFFDGDLEVYNVFFGYEKKNQFFVSRRKDLPLELNCQKIAFSDFEEFNRPRLLKNLKSTHLFKKLYSVLMSETMYTNITSSMLFYELLNNIIAELTKTKSNASSTIYDIIDYIDKNIEEKLQCADVAAVFGYHPNYINLLFKKNLGITFNKYITKCKVMRGAGLLLETNLNIAQIAAQLSFYDSGHFTKCFYKVFEKSPLYYRKSLTTL